MRIRKATLHDTEGVARLYLQFWEAHKDADPLLRPRDAPTQQSERKQAEKDIRRRNGAIFVAIEQGEIIGFVETLIKKCDAMFYVTRYGYLNSLVVDKRHRKRGIAGKLARHGLLHMKKKGISYVKLNVYRSNRPAMAAWQKLGFREISKNMIKKL